ncbi:MAG: 1-(5-phosphoribosyl)-5-[(5-phosphoribosylamino)methylideneamino] imidazole-4-carboxamide isomerase [Candidatus Omnitrophota bacterium]
MLIVPAIDIIAGQVVRLEQGDFNKKKVYGSSPLEFAQKWASQGAKLVHIVDLDGAKFGELVNFDVIKTIACESGVKVQAGGGIRTAASLKSYVDAGIERVVLSTKVLQDPDFLEADSVKERVEKIVLSLDIKYVVKGDDDTVSGKLSGLSNKDTMLLGTGAGAWSNTENIDLSDFIKKITSVGIRYINFSDIKRDGMMAGLDLAQIKNFVACARKASLNNLFFTYAGGVSSLEDIKLLAGLGSEGVDAVIIGRALYENRINLEDAIRAAEGTC